MLLAPSKCLFKWIKVDKQDYLKIGSRFLKLFLFWDRICKFLTNLECIRSYTCSLGHSDPDPCSVITVNVKYSGLLYLLHFCIVLFFANMYLCMVQLTTVIQFYSFYICLHCNSTVHICSVGVTDWLVSSISV